jgi:hypothetical protein
MAVINLALLSPRDTCHYGFATIVVDDVTYLSCDVLICDAMKLNNSYLLFYPRLIRFIRLLGHV